jgi:hypothetical protein
MDNEAVYDLARGARDVSDIILRRAQNRKRRKLRVFQQTVMIIPTTVKIGDPRRISASSRERNRATMLTVTRSCGRSAR